MENQNIEQRYDAILDDMQEDNRTEFTNDELAELNGFNPSTEQERRLISIEAGKVRRAVTCRMRKLDDFHERGGFANKFGVGSKDGNHRILTGQEYVRNQVMHNIVRLQQNMLETQYDNLALIKDMSDGADRKTINLMDFAMENAESMARTMVGQMDTGIMKLQRRHPEFKELVTLREHLDEFYRLAYEPEDEEG